MSKHPKGKRKKVLGSFPFLTVMVSSTLAITVIGLIASLILLASTLSETIKSNIELHVYLNQTSESQRIKLLTLLSSKPYVQKDQGKAQITYISQEEAEKKFINRNGDDFKRILSISPIKASFIVNIAPEFTDLKSLNRAKEDIEKNRAVFEVDFRDDWRKTIESIYRNLDKAIIVLLVFTGLSILTIVLLINNTIKLALYSQRFLIRSMQLVGAKSRFILFPFLRRSLVHGLVAGLISSLLIYSLFQYGLKKFGELEYVYDGDKIVILILALPILGMIINLLSTYIAVKKYLTMSLDELY